MLSRSDIRGLFDVNVIGVINCTLAWRDSMRDRGGRVVLNISSMAGFMNISPYGVSKLAVRGLTVAFASGTIRRSDPGERSHPRPDEHRERACRRAARARR